jgi:hypothetical protein
MQYCQKCRVIIHGGKACCPLCQAPLSGDPEPDVFPALKHKTFSAVMIARIVSFILVSWLVVLAAIQILTKFNAPWTLIAALVGILIWADVLIGLNYRSDMLKMFTSQTYVIMIVCIFIDCYTGFQGWSVSYILPIAFLWLVLATLGIARIMDMRMNEYIVYLIWDIFLCMLQIIPILMGWNRIIFPAVFCMAVMIILTAWALIFSFDQVRSALHKLLNL